MTLRADRWSSKMNTRRRAERLLIQDTDLLSTVVYSGHYYGRAQSGSGGRARAAAGSLSAAGDRRAVVADGVRDREIAVRRCSGCSGRGRGSGAPNRDQRIVEWTL